MAHSFQLSGWVERARREQLIAGGIKLCDVGSNLMARTGWLDRSKRGGLDELSHFQWSVGSRTQ